MPGDLGRHAVGVLGPRQHVVARRLDEAPPPPREPRARKTRRVGVEGVVGSLHRCGLSDRRLVGLLGGVVAVVG